MLSFLFHTSPHIITKALAAAVVGKNYSQAMQAVGGKVPYTWSASNLPAGIKLSPSGVFSGAPTKQGTTTVTVRVTDMSHQTASQAFTLVVSPAVSITSGPLPQAVQNQPYSFLLTAKDGVAPYTWSISAGTLPAGLTLNSSTGVVSGTPTVSGTFTGTFLVTDAS